ncbi:MAG TPA: Xaa-Pro peptidase family protein [Gemmatimonadota bacterium]|nr:Xaa-Pro peptidase family protein [Gemmatimonadota bacterium]
MSPVVERVREALAAGGWDGVLATPGVNLAWLTGVANHATLERSERLVCLGVPVRGEPWIVCPAFEGERMGGAVPWARVETWEEAEDPFPLVARHLEDDEAWALEPSTTFHDATRLGDGTAARLVDGAALFETLRRAKTGAEIEILGRAIDAAWDVFDEVVASLAEGESELEVAGRIADAFGRRGFDPWSLVQFGPSSAVPHGEPGERRLERGQVVLLDWGGWKDGFSADLTRTFWWDGGAVAAGESPDEVRAILEIVRSAQQAALSVMGPEVRCGDVDEAARSVIREAGYGERFTHRLGHGLGREIHEPPYLVSGSDVRLAPGDVVTVEPGIYLPGKFGVRWEDDVRVTDDGIEILSERGP